MTDRQPTYPGRVKLTPVAGQENTYDMERADSPTEEGTPLNKSTFLKDATAELYGLEGDPVPDDVFLRLQDIEADSINGIVVEKIISSQQWTTPKAYAQKFWVFICGGGGAAGNFSGTTSRDTSGGGGGGGHISIDSFEIAEGTTIDIIIGAGGVATLSGYGGTGGQSSFGNLLSANGGTGGGYGNGGSGGSGGGGVVRTLSDLTVHGKGGNGSFGGGGGGYTGGTGGTYGGDGTSASNPQPFTSGKPRIIPFLIAVIALYEGITIDNREFSADDYGDHGYGGSGGFYGGGGGYGCSGGERYVSNKNTYYGGGGGLLSDGASGSATTRGCGGGGMFGDCGRGGSDEKGGYDGACFIVYRKDVESAI